MGDPPKKRLRRFARRVRAILVHEAFKYLALTLVATAGGWILAVITAFLRLQKPLTWEFISEQFVEFGTALTTHPLDVVFGFARKDPVDAFVAVLFSAGVVTFWFLLRRARYQLRELRKEIEKGAIDRALVVQAGLGGRWPHARMEEGGAPWDEICKEILRPENTIVYLLGANGLDTFGKPGSPLYGALQEFKGSIRVILLSQSNPEIEGRAKSLNVDPKTYRVAIATSVKRLKQLAQQQHTIEWLHYDGQPNWKLIITSRTVWMQYYMPGNQHVDSTPCWRFDLTPTHGGLYHYFMMEFGRIWRRCGGGAQE